MSDTQSTKASGASFGWLFSLIGVAVMFALVLAVNFIVKRTLPVKADLTEDKIYTLSEGTREILKGLDTKVTLTFFANEDEENVHPVLTEYQPKVNALLETYRRSSPGGLLEIKRLNPEPDSKAEELAVENNVRQLQGRFGDPVFFGLTASCLDRNSTVEILDPSQERTLEHDISRAILEVTRASAPKVGFISALDIAGGPPAMPGQGRGAPEWYLHRTLNRDYDPDPAQPGSNLTRLEPDLEQVPEDIDVLLLIHPAGLSEKTQFAIDQYLLGGGEIVAFLDAHSLMADLNNPRQPNFGGQPQPAATPTSSDLEKLLPAWGIEFESNQVLADSGNMGREEWARGQPNPSVVRLTAEGVSENNSLTREVRDLSMIFPGVFYVTEKEGLETTNLVWSTEKSQLVSSALATRSPQMVLRDFEESGKEYALAVQLKGNFKTAFPDGSPDEPAGGEAEEDAEKTDDDKAESLTESKEPSTVVLVADTDMLFDYFAVSRSGEYRNQNIPLALGAIEQAVGGSNLMAIRARASTERPFTKFKEMEAEASKKYNKELAEVDKKAQEVQQELNTLIQEAMKEQQGQMIITINESPEYLAKTQELEEQVKESKKRQSVLRRELRRDVQKIKSRIELANIVIMPALVVLFGIAHLVIRRRQLSVR